MTLAGNSPVDIPFAHSYVLLCGDQRLIEVGQTREVRPLASVTKLCTAWSALVAVDRGMVSLEDAAGPEGSTLRHLLAHASGLPAESRAAQFSPARRRVYSNAGFEVLGDVLEEASGMPIRRWIEKSVFEPLGMLSATVTGSPAWGGHACVDDLLALGQEMLHPTLISPDLAAQAMSPQFPELAGVVPGYGRHTPCPWGLGIEIRGGKSPHWTGPSFPQTTVGHFGVSGAFLWVDREHHATCAFLGEEKFGPWHKEHWSILNEQLYQHITR